MSEDKKKVVVVLSGGLDSTTVLYMAKSYGHEVYPISFVYGQKHKKELEFAKKTTFELGIFTHKVIEVRHDEDMIKSALTGKEEIPKNRSLEEMTGGIPFTYVPARNTFMLGLALSYAESIEAELIYVGFNAVDYSGYPDCRPEFVEGFNELIKLATKSGVEGNPIQVVAPLIHLRKEEIIMQGLQAGVDYAKTWSCYSGEELPCGECDSCILRAKGFAEIGMADPLIGVKQE